MSAHLSPRSLFGGAISLDLPQNSIDARSVVLKRDEIVWNKRTKH